MQKILFIFLLVITTTAINAQTIYHYQKVADVNPDTGEKTADRGTAAGDRYLHIIFYSNGHILQKVDENGVKDKDFVDGEIKSIGFGLSGALHYYSGNRNAGEYSLIKNENNILTYKHYHEDTAVTPPTNASYTIKNTFYIYLSSDKKRINLYCPPNNSFKGWIKVYELYDTDEVGSIPQSKKIDPNNPTMLY